jgi:hypothetical protein
MDEPQVSRRKKKKDKALDTRKKMGPYSTRWIRMQDNKNQFPKAAKIKP